MLQLLHPSLNILELAKLDEHSNQQYDYLMDHGVSAADVLLMYCQGFEPLFEIEWYLPKNTLSLWTKHTYDEKRQWEVDRRRITQSKTHYRWDVVCDFGGDEGLYGDWVTTTHHHKKDAVRVLRVEIARLFPEVTRTITHYVDEIDYPEEMKIIPSALDWDDWRWDLPYSHIHDCGLRQHIYSQLLRAEDFVLR